MRDLLPKGIIGFDVFSSEDLMKTLGHEGTTELENSKRKILQLALWVKDTVSVDRVAEFHDGTTVTTFERDIAAAKEREVDRKARLNASRVLENTKIEPLLENGEGWEAWSSAMQLMLRLFHGSRGALLLYVMREPGPSIDLEDIT